MTGAIEQLFNYIKIAREKDEDLWKNQFSDNNPEIMEELSKQSSQIWEEFRHQASQLSEEIEQEIIELKKAGQNINLYNDKLKVSLLDFIIEGFLDSSLLYHFEAADIKNPGSVMRDAFVMNWIEAINWLIEKLPVNISDADGMPLLHHAVMHNDPKIVEFLLEKGANVTVRDNYPANVALHYARSGEIAKLLLKHGSNPNAKNLNGQTPLHKEWRELDLEVVQVLLEAGADINAKDNSGNTPLHYAISKKSLEEVKFFVDHNVDINAQNSYGETPLEFMFKYRYNEPIRSEEIDLEILEFLIENGADPNRLNSKTWNPLEKVIICQLDDELVQNKVILLLTSSKDIKIDLNNYSIRKFFTDEDNVKALFAADGYEELKAITKENLTKSLREYGESHNDQKALDIAHLLTEQGADLSSSELSTDTTNNAQSLEKDHESDYDKNYKAISLNASGLETLKNKQFDLARALFQESIDTATDNELKSIYQDNIAISFKEQGLDLSSQNEYDIALIFLDKVINATTNSLLISQFIQNKADTLYKQGVYLLEIQNNFEDAAETFMQSLALNKDPDLALQIKEGVAQAFNAEALEYYKTGHYDKAEQFYDKAEDFAVNELTKSSIWKNEMSTLFWKNTQEQFIRLCGTLLREVSRPLAQELGETGREWGKWFRGISKNQFENKIKNLTLEAQDLLKVIKKGCTQSFNAVKDYSPEIVPTSGRIILEVMTGIVVLKGITYLAKACYKGIAYTTKSIYKGIIYTAESAYKGAIYLANETEKMVENLLSSKVEKLPSESMENMSEVDYKISEVTGDCPELSEVPCEA